MFVLIGLQLPYVLAGIREYSLRQLIFYGLFFSAVVIALRMLWVFPGAFLAYFIRRHVLHQNEPMPGSRDIFVVGWTGMRGVLALAAAISLPELLEDGSAFPQRNLIIFMTFCVILVTLVLQGLTLPPLIRALGLSETSGSSEEEQSARRKILQAALAWLERAMAKPDQEDLPVYKELTRMYRRRLDSLHERADAETEEAHQAHTASRRGPQCIEGRTRNRSEFTQRRQNQRRSPPPHRIRTGFKRDQTGGGALEGKAKI